MAFRRGPPSRDPAGRAGAAAGKPRPAGSGRPHPPSQARALVQEAKSGRGRDLATLVREAQAIEDPSFAAEALFALTADPRMGTAEAVRKLDDVARLLEAVERPWRRAEAIAEVARRLPSWRERIGGKAAEAQAHAGATSLLARLVDMVVGLQAGEARSAGIQHVAGHAPAARLADLLAAALGNGSHAAEDAKAVLRAAVAHGEAAAMADRLQAHGDATQRARLLGALHVQVAKQDAGHAAAILEHALAAARSVADAADRVDVVRGLVASAHDAASLHRIAAAAANETPEAKARILSALGGRADKLGAKHEAQAWLEEALAAAQRIEDAKARQGVEANVRTGLTRLSGIDPPSQRTDRSQATHAPGAAPSAAHVATAAPPVAAAAGGKESAPPRQPQSSVASRSDAAPLAMGRSAGAGGPGGSTRHVLALCDTYEGGLGDVHLRAVARAAPLCVAFGLDLALLGFPATDAASLAAAVEAESNIGEGGRYVERLAEEGRLLLVRCTTKEPPADWSRLGLAVATTPQPDARKGHDLDGALQQARQANAPRLCVLMGLGKRGLPPAYLRMAPVHVELTGQGISMETATAMGVLAERMRVLAPVDG